MSVVTHFRSLNKHGVVPETIPTDDATSCAESCGRCGGSPGSIVYSAVELVSGRSVIHTHDVDGRPVVLPAERTHVTCDPPEHVCPTCARALWRDGYELLAVTGYPEEVAS